jgi:hypothetical protein
MRSMGPKVDLGRECLLSGVNHAAYHGSAALPQPASSVAQARARMSAATSRRPGIASALRRPCLKAFLLPLGAPGRLDELVAELTYENRHNEASPRRKALDNFQ